MANPLRGVAEDARYVSSVVNSIPGPVVLVGHSYGGIVMSSVTAPEQKVKAHVYVASFALDVGETAAQLSGKFPGSTLGDALAPPSPLPGGGNDLYIDQSRFRKQFAADVSESEARVMAIGQRPIAEAALNEPSSAGDVEADPVVLRLRFGGQEHSGGVDGLHGRAGPLAQDGSGERRLARRDDLAAGCGREADRRGCGGDEVSRASVE